MQRLGGKKLEREHVKMRKKLLAERTVWTKAQKGV